MPLLALFGRKPLTIQGGLIVETTTDIGFKLDRNSAAGFFHRHRKIAIDFTAHQAFDFALLIDRGLRERMAAVADDTDARQLVEITVGDAAKLRRNIAALVPAANSNVLPIIETANWRGVLVPKHIIANLLIPLNCNPKEMKTMSMLLDAPNSYAIAKSICDDPETATNEILIVGYLKDQHHLAREYHVRGSNGTRPKTLSEADIDNFALSVGKAAAKRPYGDLTAPSMEPMGDVTLAAVPVFHQPTDRNTVLLMVWIHYGDHDTWLKMDLDEHAPKLSKSLLQELVHRKVHGAKIITPDRPNLTHKSAS